MNQRRVGLAIFLGLGLLPMLGCAVLDGLPADLPGESAVGKHGLPPKEAAEACFATARELERNGHDAEAIQEYEKAREYNPRLAGIGHRLAVLYDRQGDYPRALAEYRQALQASPRDADLLNDLGYCHYERGDWTEAEKWLRHAVAANAKHQRAWGNLGLVLAWQERYRDSYDAFAKVVSPAEAHANVGIILAQQQKRREAADELRQALALEPELKPARVVLNRLEGAATPTETAAARPAAHAASVP